MNKQYAKVEGYSNLLRDLNTNAIINTDTFGSDQYNMLKKRRSAEKNKIETIEQDLQNVKSDLDEIKSLLKEILNGPRWTETWNYF